VVAATCIHGFAPGSCLICQTLDGGSGSKKVDSPSPKVATTVATGHGVATSRAGRQGRQRVADGPGPVRPDRVLAPRDGRHSSGAAVKVVGAVAVLGIAALFAWLVVGFVFGILHLVEIIVLAGAAGWVGYQVGRVKGRHEERPKR